jgi:hypothetical protein
MKKYRHYSDIRVSKELKERLGVEDQNAVGAGRANDLLCETERLVLRLQKVKKIYGCEIVALELVRDMVTDLLDVINEDKEIIK